MSCMLSVLLIEDDQDLADTIIEYLDLEDITCHYASNGAAGLQLARETRYDVLLLDLNLPRIDGLTLCRQLRSEGDDTPILMLTARDHLDDKIDGFVAGTDDYMVKPFALQELVVRIQALSRRRSGEVRKLTCGDLVMDMQAHTVTRGDVPVKLSPIGWKLLEVLLRASPASVSRQTLEEKVWGDELPDSNSLKVHIFNLRKAVDGPFARPLLHTVAGYGFVVTDQALKP